MSWFEILKKLKHELSVLLVLHRVEIVILGIQLSLTVVMSFVIVLWDSEESHEQPLELREQKFAVNLVLNFLGKLIKHSLLLLIVNGLVLISLPLVVEVLFDFIFQLNLDWHIIVKSSEQPEELRQIVSIIKISVQVFILIQNLDEDTHDI